MPRTELGVAPSVIVDHREHQRRRQLVSLSARKRQFVRMHARMKWSKTPRQVISFSSARRNRMKPSIPFERMKARATTSHAQRFVHGVATPIYKNTVYEFLEVLVLCIGCQFMY